MKRTVSVAIASLLMASACFGLTACSDAGTGSSNETQQVDSSEEQTVQEESGPTEEVLALFNSGDYEGALEKFSSVEQGSEEYEDVCTAVYDCAISLYELGDYSNAGNYFLRLVNSESTSLDMDECSNYLQLCYAMQDSESEIADLFYRTTALVDMSDEGFQPATEALETVDAFSGYINLARGRGLYRSDNTIDHYTTIPGTGSSLGDNTPVNSYIYISQGLYATTLVSEGALITMDGSKAYERAKDNQFETDVDCIGTDVFHCSSSYTDSVTGDAYTIEFDLTLGDGFFDIGNVVTTEDAGNYTICEGRYSKIE